MIVLEYIRLDHLLLSFSEICSYHQMKPKCPRSSGHKDLVQWVQQLHIRETVSHTNTRAELLWFQITNYQLNSSLMRIKTLTVFCKCVEHWKLQVKWQFFLFCFLILEMGVFYFCCNTVRTTAPHTIHMSQSQSQAPAGGAATHPAVPDKCPSCWHLPQWTAGFGRSPAERNTTTGCLCYYFF